MKYLLSINELFDLNSTTDATVVKAILNNDKNKCATIEVKIKDIHYKFSLNLRTFETGTFIYIAYHILDHDQYIRNRDKNNTKYQFIINRGMTISVLNSLYNHYNILNRY